MYKNYTHTFMYRIIHCEFGTLTRLAYNFGYTTPIIWVISLFPLLAHFCTIREGGCGQEEYSIWIVGGTGA